MVIVISVCYRIKNPAFAGERPFRCQLVPNCKAFAKSNELKRHLRDVHNIMPYACNRCGARFNKQLKFAKHKRTSNCEIKEKKGRATDAMEPGPENEQVSAPYHYY